MELKCLMAIYMREPHMIDVWRLVNCLWNDPCFFQWQLIGWCWGVWHTRLKTPVNMCLRWVLNRVIHSFHSVCFFKMICGLLLSSCFSPVHCTLQASWSDGFVSSVVRTQKEVKELLSQVWVIAETHSPSLAIIITGFTTESSNSFPHLFQIRVLFLITKCHAHSSVRLYKNVMLFISSAEVFNEVKRV